MEKYWIALAGGALIGAASVWFMASLGRIAGISGILGGLLPPTNGDGAAWRVPFLIGLALGPVAVALVAKSSPIGVPIGGLPVLIAGGLLVGIGTALGKGCTSGHGVCGMARLSPRSVVATATFMVAAVLTVFVARHML